MAVPNRAQQINRVADVLEKWADEDMPVEEAAKRIVDGMYEMWQKDVNTPPMSIVTGQAFKLPWSSSIYRVTWEGDADWGKGALRKVVWVTDSTTKQGTVALADADVWRLATPSSSKAEPKPNALGFNIGDKLSVSQRRYHYAVLATHEKCLLLRETGTFKLQVESNDLIEKYYRRESS